MDTDIPRLVVIGHMIRILFMLPWNLLLVPEGREYRALTG